MKSLIAIASALWIAAAVPALSQTNPVVVELFTSQGCSSCPPADEMLRELATREDVIALALHVDYWDYIGWKDSFALPGNTERQKAYAMQGGRNSVYTPQMIVNGTDDVVGPRAMELAKYIAAHAALPDRVRLQARRDGDRVLIGATLLPGAEPRGMVVQLVHFTPEQSVDITRGENAGRKLTYTNVVEDWIILGEWDGRAPLEMNVAAGADLPGAVLIQYQNAGAIVAAARVD
ncbi:MAG: DUF1223 domain-containing protein [Rhodobacteraceae bacterium]|nr:MAG: DUF1223 domain-containing protein [Paracoccaceae bacterium]